MGHGFWLQCYMDSGSFVWLRVSVLFSSSFAVEGFEFLRNDFFFVFFLPIKHGCGYPQVDIHTYMCKAKLREQEKLTFNVEVNEKAKCKMLRKLRKD